MYCGNCGREVPDGSRVCGYCGSPMQTAGYQGQAVPGGRGMSGGQVMPGGNAYGGQYHTGYGRRPGIENIFSALVHERTNGAIAELTFWCIMCAAVIASLIAIILGEQNVTWIMLFIFTIGMGVLMAFRLKPILLLCSVVFFNLTTFIIHFASFCQYDLGDQDYCSYFVLNTVLFIVLLVAAVTTTVFAFIHFFSRFNFGTLISLLVIIQSGCVIVLQVLMYAVPFFGKYASEEAGYYRSGVLNEKCYWLGTATFWVVLIVMALFYAFFFWGAVDNRKGKIIGTSAGGRMSGAQPGLRGVAGMYAGQVFPIHGGTFSIGSANGMNIVIPDAHISSRHCVIRFNPASGLYEVYDNSTNGTYLNNGARLQSGVYNPVPRGSVLWIGSQAYQFQLL